MPRTLPDGTVIVPMDPETIKKALEGQQDVIGPAYAAHRAYFDKLRCWRCDGKVQEFVDPSRLFREGDVLPNYLARCLVCGCEFEPYTGIEVALPNLVKAGAEAEISVVVDPSDSLEE